MAIKLEVTNGGQRITRRQTSGPNKGEVDGSVSTAGIEGIRRMDVVETTPSPTELAPATDIAALHSRLLGTAPAFSSPTNPEDGNIAFTDEWSSAWIQNLSPEEQVAYMATRTMPGGLGEDQAHDVFEGTKRNVARLRPVPEQPTEEQFAAWVDLNTARITDPDNGLDEEQRAYALERLQEIADGELPNGVTFAIMSKAAARTWSARYALDDQARQIAGWMDVHEWDVKAQISKYRDEYYAIVEAGGVPEMDEGYLKAWGRTSGSSPKDPATRYSHWRAENVANYPAPKKPKVYAALDTETTGLSATENHIIEIGIVFYDSEGTETGRWSKLIRPPLDEDGTLSTGGPDLIAVHHITPEDVADAPTFPEVMADMQERLTGATLIGHNLGFDTKFLRMNLKKHAPADDKAAGYPTWGMEADTLHHASRHMTGLENNKLNTVAASFGIVNPRAHRATEDAAVSGEIFFKVKAQIAERRAQTTAENV